MESGRLMAATVGQVPLVHGLLPSAGEDELVRVGRDHDLERGRIIVGIQDGLHSAVELGLFGDLVGEDILVDDVAGKEPVGGQVETLLQEPWIDLAGISG